MTRALAVVALLAAVAHGDDAPKKDRVRAGKKATATAPPVPGPRPVALVNLFNEHTHEWLAVEPGRWPTKATIARFLRDHYTNQPTEMEPKLVEMVVGAATALGSDTVMIVSGFRHEKYNLILRKKGHQVARDSQHTHGNAIDFYLPKIATEKLHAWAKEQALGGVGLYLDSGFVHMDTGKIRYWSGE